VSVTVAAVVVWQLQCTAVYDGVSGGLAVCSSALQCQLQCAAVSVAAAAARQCATVCDGVSACGAHTVTDREQLLPLLLLCC
jgi:hypothetical protein